MEKKIAYNCTSVKGLSAEEVAEILISHYGPTKSKDLTSKTLLDDAKNPQHPLHHYFEWDDAVAADLYRIEQARKLIASIIVIHKDNSRHRMFVNIMEDDDGKDCIGFKSQGSKYLSIDDVLADPINRQKMLNNAKREMLVFKRKYSTLKELANVIEAIDKLVD